MMSDEPSLINASPKHPARFEDAKISPISPPSLALFSKMSSPLEKRRSHLQRITVDATHRHFSNKNKRVSFHQDFQRSPEEPEDNSTSHRGQHYQSNWVLNDDCSITRILPPQMRRYQSDCFLNQSGDALSKHLPLAERGTPEGQEDPEHICSFQNLSTNINSGGPIPTSHEETIQRFSISNRLSALNLLSSLKASILANKDQKPKLFEKAEEKRALMQWAQEKWSNRFLISLPTVQLTKDSSLNEPKIDGGIQQTVLSESFNLDMSKQYKIFKCFVDFYSGKPRHSYLLLNEKVVHVASTLDTNLTSPSWSSPLLDMVDVTVKWNYSVLKLRRSAGLGVSSSTISIEFVDPDCLRTAASTLDVMLRKVQKRCDAVTVQLLTQCELFRELSFFKHEAHKDVPIIHYVGLIYFEESFISPNTNDCTAVDETCGHLMYRWSHKKNWLPGYFQLKSGVLSQFNHVSDQAPFCTMSLSEEECKGYGRNFNSSRPHTIEIQFRGNKCLFLAGASEAEASFWLSGLSQSSSYWENSNFLPLEQQQLPIPCGIIVSQQEVILFRTSQMNDPIARIPLDIISDVMISPGDDTFCLIECDCQEAREGAGDLILYFQSSKSFEEFLQAINLPRQVLSNEIASILRNKTQTLNVL